MTSQHLEADLHRQTFERSQNTSGFFFQEQVDPCLTIWYSRKESDSDEFYDARETQNLEESFFFDSCSEVPIQKDFSPQMHGFSVAMHSESNDPVSEPLRQHKIQGYQGKDQIQECEMKMQQHFNTQERISEQSLGGLSRGHLLTEQGVHNQRHSEKDITLLNTVEGYGIDKNNSTVIGASARPPLFKREEAKAQKTSAPAYYNSSTYRNKEENGQYLFKGHKKNSQTTDDDFFFINQTQKEELDFDEMSYENIPTVGQIEIFQQTRDDNFEDLKSKRSSFSSSILSSGHDSKLQPTSSFDQNLLNKQSNSSACPPSKDNSQSKQFLQVPQQSKKQMSMSDSTFSKLFVNISEIKKNLPKPNSISQKSFDNSPGRLGSQVAVKEKTKLHKKSYTELNNLFLAQEFSCGSDAIWVLKFRKDGQYLATGGKDGVVRIWVTCEGSDACPKKTINPVPHREYKNLHKSDIFDINWCEKNPNLLLTASSDCTVALWNITLDKPIQIFQHPDIVSTVVFKVNTDKFVASGCFDKFVRIWDIKNRKVIDWQQTGSYITQIQYNTIGSRLVVGLVCGDCLVYDSTQEKLSPLMSISCKNKRGKFSNGRKVTGIDFLSISIAMVTTNDSRIWFLDIKNGKQIYKIKGHKNENFLMKASISDDFEHVICGSEDGDLYMWSHIQSTVNAMSKRGVFGKLLTTDRSDSCEYFQPFSKSMPITIAQFAPEQVRRMQMKKNLRLYTEKLQWYYPGVPQRNLVYVAYIARHPQEIEDLKALANQNL